MNCPAGIRFSTKKSIHKNGASALNVHLDKHNESQANLNPGAQVCPRTALSSVNQGLKTLVRRETRLRYQVGYLAELSGCAPDNAVKVWFNYRF